MAYTFTEVEKFDIDSEWDSLYADSLADLEGGTINFGELTDATEKKNLVISLVNDDNVVGDRRLKIYKDGVPAMFNYCYFQNNHYIWVTGTVAKINNSKSWTASTEFHQANKDFVQSLGGTHWGIECIKGSAIDTFYTMMHNNGICFGTLVETDLEYNMKRMLWEY